MLEVYPDLLSLQSQKAHDQSFQQFFVSRKIKVFVETFLQKELRADQSCFLQLHLLAASSASNHLMMLSDYKNIEAL